MSDQHLAVIPTYSARNAHRVEQLSVALSDAGRSVIVVANSDKARDSLGLADLPKSTTVMCTDQNLGFGGAVNHALAGRLFETAMIVNDDVELGPRSLEAVADVTDRLSADPKLAVVSFVPESSERVSPWPSWLGVLLRVGGVWSIAKRLQAVRSDQAQFEFFCVMVSGPCWRRIGGFAPARFPLYFEDADLIFRLVREGLSVDTVECDVDHLGSSTSRSMAQVPALQTVGACSFLVDDLGWSDRSARLGVRAAHAVGLVVDLVRWRKTSLAARVDLLRGPIPPDVALPPFQTVDSTAHDRMQT